jgi:hypothetical protein
LIAAIRSRPDKAAKAEFARADWAHPSGAFACCSVESRS